MPQNCCSPPANVECFFLRRGRGRGTEGGGSGGGGGEQKKKEQQSSAWCKKVMLSPEAEETFEVRINRESDRHAVGGRTPRNDAVSRLVMTPS